MTSVFEHESAVEIPAAGRRGRLVPGSFFVLGLVEMWATAAYTRAARPLPYPPHMTESEECWARGRRLSGNALTGPRDEPGATLAERMTCKQSIRMQSQRDKNRHTETDQSKDRRTDSYIER